LNELKDSRKSFKLLILILIMPKKKIVRKTKKKKENFIEEEIEEIEQWVIERKRFLIKLAWVAGLIIVLLIISLLI